MLSKVGYGSWAIALHIYFCSISAGVHADGLRVGFAEVPITPEVVDEWVDVNDDAQFDPEIDTWSDGNGNGRFDPVWIAGFQRSRAAQGVKDDLMAVSVVIDDGNTRIGCLLYTSDAADE